MIKDIYIHAQNTILSYSDTANNLLDLSARQESTTLTYAVAFVLFTIGFIWLLKQLICICPPNQALIFSGLKRKMPDGSVKGYRVLIGGRGILIPFLETVQKIRLSTIVVPISIREVYSKGGVVIDVDAVANVKISSDPVTINNAIERFLGRKLEDVRRVAKETLEGQLRGVVARLTPEEVNEDRIKFLEILEHESEEDLNKLGMHLDSLKILHVRDEKGYLDAIGRQAIANVVRTAELAESDAKREAEQAIAIQNSRSGTIEANVEANIAKMKNDLRSFKAQLEAKIQSEYKRTEVAPLKAKALSEQELQKVRSVCEEIRLQCDINLPAEAELQVEQYNAMGEAAIEKEKGLALSHAIDVLGKAWNNCGDDAQKIAILSEIDVLLEEASKSLQKVKVNKMRVLHGDAGLAIKEYVKACHGVVYSMFDATKLSTGMDIPSILNYNTKTLAGTSKRNKSGGN